MTPDVDVLIMGAGLSGIGAACHLQRERPGTTYTIIEQRDAMGGTWDLFRYPGVRSDSDMYTLGYDFKPWRGEHALASGPEILRYIREAAAQYHVDRHIRYRHKGIRAEWSSEEAMWTATAQHTLEDGTVEEVTITARFLYSCSGYYDYDQGYAPQFPGIDEFGGTVIHPQFWPEDLDYAGKRVVVIGSGATAVTLVPAMAATAGHVTMLQRSPTYVFSLPSADPVADAADRLLPGRAAYTVTRWNHILAAWGLYQVSRRRPAMMRGFFRREATKLLPENYPVDVHFNPRYDPWDQRLCLVPDGDLHAAITAGQAEIVTDTIESFTPTGIRLASGRHLDADIVVTATGLVLKPGGGATLVVDGREVDLPTTVSYRGMMLCGVPNFALALGYINASWTLRVDLVSRYVCRLLTYMDRHGFTSAWPKEPPSGQETRPIMEFAAGYIQRSSAKLPRQGSSGPWKVHQNYLVERRLLGRRARIEEEMEFRRGGPGQVASPAASMASAGQAPGGEGDG
ncbi:MAG: NAD(P)/FAD-dependent oxidoreductase [Tetrasphaera sp.]|jgi:monooxygenase|nr:NAD(P)/FAD-dependent oxidoreductase [Tetrasphaera sp.]